MAVDDRFPHLLVGQIDAPSLRRIDPGDLALEAADGLDCQLSRLVLFHLRDLGAGAVSLNWTYG
jgi:hypothetical protein